MNDTLAYHKTRPLVRPLDLSHVSVSQMAKNFKKVTSMLAEHENDIQARPEAEALWFYVLNHAVAEISLLVEDDEPLGDFLPIVQKYHADIQRKSLRMFYYLVFIASREARHCGHTHDLLKLYEQFPSKLVALHKRIRSDGFSTTSFAKWAPNESLGVWLELMEKQFTVGSYGSSYGGKPWANIAKVAKQFVYGEITAEMMMDTGFTLAHNCGPIFNKGMLYYGQNNSTLLKVLDVQRSGQIPQLINDGGVHHVSTEHKDFVAEAAKVLPSFRGSVDWYMVEALGAVGSYNKEKSLQDTKGSAPTGSQTVDKIKQWKKKAAAYQKEKQQKEFLASHIEIMPGEYVAIVNHIRKAS